ARRHRQPKARHLGEVGALATQQVAHIGAPLRGAVAETVDPLCGRLRRRRLSQRRLSHGQPSILEKSATESMVARMRLSNFSLFSRKSVLSVMFTVTFSKKESIGARKPAKARIAPAKSSRASAGFTANSTSSSAVATAFSSLCSSNAALGSLAIFAAR